MKFGCGKKLHVSKFWGPEDLYPVVRTSSSVVFGSAFFDSRDGGHFAHHKLQREAMVSFRLDRANSGARNEFALDDTRSETRNPIIESLDQQCFRI